MSGGHFDYAQHHIQNIAESVAELIESNDDDTLNEWGDIVGRHYSPDTIEQFRIAYELLRKAQIYAQRIDWLVSGDDGEDCFHRRLAEDLAELEGEL